MIISHVLVDRTMLYLPPYFKFFLQSIFIFLFFFDLLSLTTPYIHVCIQSKNNRNITRLGAMAFVIHTLFIKAVRGC